MSEELAEQISVWNDDPDIGAILLTGEGRAFCAGADLGGFAQRIQDNANSSGPAPTRRTGSSITHLLRRSKPTVAAFREKREPHFNR